jgi:hypothetical protein
MRFRHLFSAALLIFTAACSSQSEDDASSGDNAITSNDGNILSFEFTGQVTADSDAKTREAIITQLAYVQGILTTNEHGNGHVGHVQLTDVSETPSGAKKTIAYKALLPVAWPKTGRQAPATYELPLPKDVTALAAFNAKYDGKCGTNEYGQDTFWHDWNPQAQGCAIDEADVVRMSAKVGKYAGETQGKYPEYDLVWSDGELDVAVIFGIINGGSTDDPSDPGVQAMEEFIGDAMGAVHGAQKKTNAKTASILRDTTVTGTVSAAGAEKPVSVSVLLVAELASVGADFDPRWNDLSTSADLIMYDGHAGLGKNVNALARKGVVTKGKYQLILLNGCQTFAYIDTTLNDRRTEANGAAEDPNGTMFMDVIGNALPGYTNNLAPMSSTLLRALADADHPKTYNDILSTYPSEHLVVVFGEEDNRYHP